MLTLQHQEEALSWAYVQAVAAQAGVSLMQPNYDYGIDGTLLSQLESGQWPSCK